MASIPTIEMGTGLGHVVALAVLVAACARKGSTTSPQAPPDRPQASQATDGTQLWALVDASSSPAGPLTSVELFRQQLMKLPGEEIVRVDKEFDEQLARAYSWQVWGAAYVINVRCSDDSRSHG